MGDPESLFAAVEDERHNQIFLVIQMTDQPLQKRATRICVTIAASSQRIVLGLQRLQERVGGFRGAGHVLMNMMMIPFQDHKAPRQPRVCGAEDGEIVPIFNLVMDV